MLLIINNIIKVINYLGVNECKDYETIMDRNINNINTLKIKKYSSNYENIYGSNKTNNLNLYNLVFLI